MWYALYCKLNTGTALYYCMHSPVPSPGWYSSRYGTVHCSGCSGVQWVCCKLEWSWTGGLPIIALTSLVQRHSVVHCTRYSAQERGNTSQVPQPLLLVVASGQLGNLTIRDTWSVLQNINMEVWRRRVVWEIGTPNLEFGNLCIIPLVQEMGEV